jgi:hypothetical protein
MFTNIREKRSLIFYCDMKVEWAREEYRVLCTRNEGSRLTWFKNGILKLKGTRKRSEKGRCLLRREEDDDIHILLNVRKRGSGGNSCLVGNVLLLVKR